LGEAGCFEHAVRKGYNALGSFWGESDRARDSEGSPSLEEGNTSRELVSYGSKEMWIGIDVIIGLRDTPIVTAMTRNKHLFFPSNCLSCSLVRTSMMKTDTPRIRLI
jgi:hypothetical protein